MIICFLDPLKKSWKKKKSKNKKGNSRGVTTSQLPQKKIRMMKLFALILYLLARITLTLISSSAITRCFQKFNIPGFNLVILNFDLPSALLHFSCKLFKKYAVLCGNNSVTENQGQLALCSKSLYKSYWQKILPVVCRFEFCPPYKSRVKLIFISHKSIKSSQKTMQHLLTLLKRIFKMLIEKYWEFILDLLTLTKEITKSCEEFERVNSR